jgi:hypothetical protein
LLEIVGPSVLEFCNEINNIGHTANLALPADWGKQLYEATIAYRQKGGAHKPSALVDILTGRPFEVECASLDPLSRPRDPPPYLLLLNRHSLPSSQARSATSSGWAAE